MHWLGRYRCKAGYNFDVRHIEEIKNGFEAGTCRPPFHGDVESPRLLSDIDLDWHAFDLQPAECTLRAAPEPRCSAIWQLSKGPLPSGPVCNCIPLRRR
jgi:hypothetical protein